MACRLDALCFDALEPLRLARFWSELLGWTLSDDPGNGVALLPRDDTGFQLRFRPSENGKTCQNPRHIDLTSRSLQDQQETVRRSLELGARHVDVGQRPEEGHVVLCDLEGNEFCVVEPGNRFLADCGFIGAISCEGSRQVGYFWSDALDWPLVWDQDEETAIRSPHGGPKVSWSGRQPTPEGGKCRVRFELRMPLSDDDLRAEADRLISLGARSRENSREPDSLALIDPDGEQFWLLA